VQERYNIGLLATSVAAVDALEYITDNCKVVIDNMPFKDPTSASGSRSLTSISLSTKKIKTRPPMRNLKAVMKMDQRFPSAV